MRSIHDVSFVGIIIGLIVVVGLIAGVGGIVTSDERPPIGQAPPITENTTAEGKMVSQSQSMSESPQTYAVTAASAEAIDTAQLAEYGEVGTQVDARIEVTIPPSDIDAIQNISWVTSVRPVVRAEPAQTDIPGSSEGVGENSLGVQQAHANGITGEGVEVGIIDKGFDADNPEIASDIVDERSFRSSSGDPAHGTSVAEIVTRTAPDSRLYLTSTSTGTDIEAAISYLTSQGVDIIVHSQGIPALDDDGDHIITDDINAATENGVLFVNSAGNEAERHWEGKFRDNDGDDFHEWTASGDELNCLPSCNMEYSGSITVYVRWDDKGQESHYRPSISNPETDDFIRIGGERVFTTPSGTKYTILSAEDIQSQQVDLVVDHVSGPADDKIEVIVFEGPREMQRNIPASSIIAPADVPATTAVAAYQVGSRQLAPYSSRGPTDDERTGIDVTGYTNIGVTNGLYGGNEFIFTGTSAAAPYVGGVAALVEENQAGDQSPTELTSTLKSSSDDILDPGIDTASGSGVVNAADAVDVAEGTLTGEIRDQEDNRIEDSALEVSLERRTTTGDFEQIRASRQVSDGQYTFEALATGEKYRVNAAFQGETGSATIESLTPGTNTRDVVIPEVTLAEEIPPDVTQTVSSSEVAPGEEVSATTRFSDLNNGEFNATITYTPLIQSVTGTVTANGSVLSENTIESTDSVGITAFTGSGGNLTFNQNITVSETAGTTHEIAGTVTSGGATTQIDPVTITVTEQGSGSSSEIDVTRTISSNEVAPGEQITVTTEVTGITERGIINTTYAPPVQSTTTSVSVDGTTVNPFFKSVDQSGSFITVVDVTTAETIIVTEELTVASETNTTHEITGSVQSSNQTVEIPQKTVTVTSTPTSPSESVIDEYDADNDGIGKRDTQDAIRDFLISGELEKSELQKVIREFIVG